MTCIDRIKSTIRNLIMSWAVVFWSLYGVGSTLFVVYLFRLGKSVVSHRDKLTEDEIGRHLRAAIDDTAQLAAFSVPAESREPGSKPSGRLHVERIFHPNDDYVSVQGVRDGATCVINFPVGLLSGEPDASPRPGRDVRDC